MRSQEHDLLHQAWLAAAIAAILLAPLAGANEAHPDCEPGQENKLQGSGLVLCEGEHWDGQDPTGSNAVRYGVGNPGTPVITEPVQAGVRGETSGNVYVYASAYGVGEMTTYASASGRIVGLYARDGTNQVFDNTPVEGALIFADNLLSRSNPGADGNVLAWVFGVEGTAISALGISALEPFRLADEKTGEGDCTQHVYETQDCERDNPAVTLMIP